MTQENIMRSEDGALFTLSDTAELLKFSDRATLIEWLRDRNMILMDNFLAKRVINAGYMKYQLEEIDIDGVTLCMEYVIMVSIKGLNFLQSRMISEVMKKTII